MYFYPHYIRATSMQKTTIPIYSILNRMPALYDTRIMPGAILNALGVNRDKFLSTSVEKFGSGLLGKIDSAQNQLVSSRC